jgi:hypothetical protein
MSFSSFNTCYALSVSKPVVSGDYGPTNISQVSATADSVNLSFYPPTNYPPPLIIQI